MSHTFHSLPYPKHEYQRAKEADPKFNRYSNILPFDHSLPPGDYLNASCITLQNSKCTYIATQSPPPPTFERFWEVAWNAAILVNLAAMEEVEIGKADQYWPEHGQTREYGTMQVTNIREEKIKDTPWIRRSLIIEQLNNRPRGQEDDSGEKRELILIHVTDWIDFGAFDAHSLATLVLEVDSIIAQSRQDTKVTKEGGICDQAHADRPCIMVHCSAGVGRTGTFIGAHSIHHSLPMWTKTELQGIIFKTVSEMRDSRMKMVQTEGQYRRIAEAVEYLRIAEKD